MGVGKGGAVGSGGLGTGGRGGDGGCGDGGALGGGAFGGRAQHRAVRLTQEGDGTDTKMHRKKIWTPEGEVRVSWEPHGMPESSTRECMTGIWPLGRVVLR